MESLRQAPHGKPTLRSFLLAILLLPAALAWADEQYSEYQLKAAYLFNFLKFVEWPQESSARFSQLQICTASTDPLIPYLKPLEQKQVRNHEIRINVYDSVLDIADCNLIYFSTIPADKREAILMAVASRPVLTVGTEGQYDDENEIVTFFNEDGKLRFDVNYRLVRERGLHMSSRLLKLARVSEK